MAKGTMKKPGKKRGKMRVFIITACVVALLGLLVLLFWDPVFRYIVHPAYTSSKLAAFAREAKTAEKGQIVFLGDSIVDSCDLAKYYPEFTAYNRGVMGDSTSHVLKRLDDVYVLQPSVIVLLVGTNDFINEGRTADEAAAYYDDILTALAANSPDTKVICQSIYPGYDGLFMKMSPWQDEIKQLNTQIEQLAAAHGYVYIDLYTLLLDPATGLGSRDYFKDGAHPNEVGYTLAAEVLKPLIVDALATGD